MANTAQVELDLIALWYLAATGHRPALFVHVCFPPKHPRTDTGSSGCRVARHCSELSGGERSLLSALRQSRWRTPCCCGNGQSDYVVVSGRHGSSTCAFRQPVFRSNALANRHWVHRVVVLRDIVLSCRVAKDRYGWLCVNQDGEHSAVV